MIPRQKLTVERYGAGEFVKGRWSEGTSKEYTFYSTVQPADGRDLEVLEESRRNSDSYVLITDFHLRTVNLKVTDKSTNPDRVKLFGEDYEVAHVKRWGNSIRPNYWALVSKVPQ
jgi:hypothetical protein